MNPWTRRSKAAELEAKGAPVIVPGYPGWTFHVRPDTPWSAMYQRAIARISEQPETREYIARASEPGYERTTADALLDEENARRVFAEAGIAAWDGVTGEDGKPYPHTAGNAAKLLAHFPDIYNHLRAASRDKVLFAIPDTDTIAGN